MKYKNEWVLVNGRWHNRPDMTLYKFDKNMKAKTMGYVLWSDSRKAYYSLGKNGTLGWFKTPSEGKKYMLESYGLGKVREIQRSKLTDDYWKVRKE